MTCGNTITTSPIINNAINYYQQFMEASTGTGSIYIKAKETLTAILDEAGIDATQRATALSNMVVNMVNGLSAQAMQAAIDVAKDERDAPYALAKTCLDGELTKAQTDKVKADKDAVATDIKVKTAQGWLAQAQLYRDFGVIPSSLMYSKDVLTTSDYDADYGTKYAEMEQAKAARYVAYATSWRANGQVVPTVDANGVMTGAIASTADGSEGLTYQQTRIADRQVKGYDDNMRQHAANSSAAFLSMLLSADAPIDSGALSTYIGKWITAVDYLNTNTVV